MAEPRCISSASRPVWAPDAKGRYSGLVRRRKAYALRTLWQWQGVPKQVRYYSNEEWGEAVLFIVIIGAVGTLLILFANRVAGHQSSGFRKSVSRPIEMLGIFLLGIAAIVLGASLILPFIVAGLTMLF